MSRRPGILLKLRKTDLKWDPVYADMIHVLFARGPLRFLLGSQVTCLTRLMLGGSKCDDNEAQPCSSYWRSAWDHRSVGHCRSTQRCNLRAAAAPYQYWHVCLVQKGLNAIFADYESNGITNAREIYEAPNQ